LSYVHRFEVLDVLGVGIALVDDVLPADIGGDLGAGGSLSLGHNEV